MSARSRIPGFNSDSFVSVIWCCITNYSKTWWLKKRAIFSLEILWVGLWFYTSLSWPHSCGCLQLVGQLGAKPSQACLPSFPMTSFILKEERLSFFTYNFRAAFQQGNPQMDKHLSNLLYLCPTGQSTSSGQAQSQCKRGWHKGMDTGDVIH